jgi:hypothetical protein
LAVFVGDSSTDAILYATDDIDDLGFWHPASRDVVVSADAQLSGTAGTIFFQHVPLHSTTGLMIGGVAAPDEISGRIDWSCAR